eukprot:TRINITY_DN32728_c0_g1_i1.p1 TRINITY_DN32728_c0_g1~~TRINITY_DN32728_c0_g1_i1.p1  ORF type:complete len:1493 (-),score=253.48 TRINITY_DN32728_c0_g1_i1:383-4786(-)
MAALVCTVALILARGDASNDWLVKELGEDPLDDAKPSVAEEVRVKNLLDPSINFIELQYSFDMMRFGVERQAKGNVWISFVNGMPIIRLQGETSSTTLGDAIVSVLIDTVKLTTYAIIDIGDLHEAECVAYPFPKAGDFPEVLNRIKWRGDNLGPPEDILERLFATGKSFTTKWTSSTLLRLDFGMARELLGVDMLRGDRVTKHFKVSGLNTMHAVPKRASGYFQSPVSSCQTSNQDPNPIVGIPSLAKFNPFGTYSPLMDMVMTLTPHDRVESRFLVILSALALPGDVSAAIELPTFPDVSKAGLIAFDYVSDIYSTGTASQSSGSMWIDMGEIQAFHLRGESTHSVVGPLILDLIGDCSSPDESILVNVNLLVQEKRKCVTYKPPGLSEAELQELKDISVVHEFRFLRVDTVNTDDQLGEDCAVFLALMSRGRSMQLYVDLEADASKAIVRIDVYRSRDLVRRTTVSRWHSSTDSQATGMLSPRPEWKCGFGKGPVLADLGLDTIDQRSIDLREAMWALENKRDHPVFLLSELLLLPGNIAMSVEIPQLPDLNNLDYAFDVKMLLMPRETRAPAKDAVGNDITSSIPVEVIMGRIERKNGVATLWATKAGAASVSLEIDEDSLVAEVGPKLLTGGGAECLSLSLPVVFGISTKAAVGSFVSVDALGKEECNHFTYTTHNEIFQVVQVDLWYNIEKKQVRRIEMMRPRLMASPEKPRLAVIMDFYEADSAKTYPSMEQKSCFAAADVRGPWLRFASAMGSQFSPDTSENAANLPWWVSFNVNPQSEDMGNLLSAAFSTDQQRKFGVDVHGKVVNEAIFSAAMKSRIEAGWMGCFADNAHSSLVDPNPGSVEQTTTSCGEICGHYGFMALQAGKCLCTNSAAPTSRANRIDDKECGSLCTGEEMLLPRRYCGGPTQNAIYRVPVIIRATPVRITRVWIGSETTLAPALHDGDLETLVDCAALLPQTDSVGCENMMIVVELSRSVGSAVFQVFGNSEVGHDPSTKVSISLDGKTWDAYSAMSGHSVYTPDGKFCANDPLRYIGIQFGSPMPLLSEILLDSAQEMDIKAIAGVNDYGFALGVIGLLSTKAATALAHLEIKPPNLQFAGGGSSPKTRVQMQADLFDAYVGCYIDDAHHDMEFQVYVRGAATAVFTTRICAQACVAFKYMALQNGACYCGDTYATAPQYTKIADAECAPECPGEQSLIPHRLCGAANRNAIYRARILAEVLNVPMATSDVVDIQSVSLKYVSFSFRSGSPLKSVVEVNTATIPRAWHRGSGQLYVDFAKRRLLLRGKAENVSAGIPSVDTSILFRGDRSSLYSFTRIPPSYQNCWSLNTAAVIHTLRGGTQPNPFARAVSDGGMVSVGSGVHAKRLSVFLGPNKRVDLYVGVSTGQPLLAINLLDLSQGSSAVVAVTSWSTDPIADALFEPDGTWTCEAKSQSSAASKDLAKWDVVRLFFPDQDVPLEELP